MSNSLFYLVQSVSLYFRFKLSKNVKKAIALRSVAHGGIYDV